MSYCVARKVVAGRLFRRLTWRQRLFHGIAVVAVPIMVMPVAVMIVLRRSLNRKQVTGMGDVPVLVGVRRRAREDAELRHGKGHEAGQETTDGSHSLKCLRMFPYRRLNGRRPHGSGLHHTGRSSQFSCQPSQFAAEGGDAARLGGRCFQESRSAASVPMCLP
jgi:hypothetical protein